MLKKISILSNNEFWNIMKSIFSKEESDDRIIVLERGW